MKRTHEALSKWGLDRDCRLRCQRAACGVARRSMSSGPSFGSAFRLWRIDPCGGRFVGRSWRFFDETLRVFTERMIEGELARRVNGVDLPVVYLIRGHQADPCVVMLLIV